MNRVAIVIIYDGEQPSDNVKANISEMLYARTAARIEGNVNIYTMNEAEIAAAIVGKIKTSSSTYTAEQTSAVDQAVIYLGTVFARDIISGGMQFTKALATQCIAACLERDNEKLITSVRLVAKSSFSSISESVCKKYNFSISEYRTVCKVYDSICAGHIVE